MTPAGPVAPTPVDLTVVVPTRDRPGQLAGCLDAIARLDPAPGEVVVVDSASSDARAIADAAAAAGSARLLRCDRPGASRARNVGWEAATTAVVAFVDDDVRVRADWVEQILAPFASDDVVLVTGAVRADEGHDRAVAVTDDVADGPFDHTFLGNVGASANLAVRRDALAAVGGFDVLLGAGGRFRAAEDLDLFDRLLARGDGWHASGAVGIHDQWRTRVELVRLDRDYGFGFGARLSKLLRSDRRRGTAVLGFELRRLRADLVKDLRARYRLGIVGRLIWSLALVAGLVAGLATPVRDGHLRPRGSR